MSEFELLTVSHNWRVEGYWRAAKDSAGELPWPEITTWEPSDFISMLQRVEADSPTIAYRGFSISRITGEINGSREFVRNGWRWPEGLMHYVRHKVKPSDEFMAFIEQEAANLPPNP